jgi:hypothetical protein
MGQQPSCDRAKALSEISKINADALSELKGRLTGSLVLPGDANYNESRTTWNRDIMGFPSAIVVAENNDDIKHVLR